MPCTVFAATAYVVLAPDSVNALCDLDNGTNTLTKFVLNAFWKSKFSKAVKVYEALPQADLFYFGFYSIPYENVYPYVKHIVIRSRIIYESF